MIEPNRLAGRSPGAAAARAAASVCSASIARSTRSARTLPDYAVVRLLSRAPALCLPRALLAAFGEQREPLCQLADAGAEVLRHRPGHRAQRQQALGALAPALPQVPAPDLRGVGRAIDPALLLGQGLLRAAARPRVLAPGRRCAHSPSSGSASCTAAGRTARPTTRPPISTPSSAAARRCSTDVQKP